MLAHPDDFDGDEDEPQPPPPVQDTPTFDSNEVLADLAPGFEWRLNASVALREPQDSSSPSSEVGLIGP